MSLTLAEKYELLAGTVSYRAIVADAVPWLVDALVRTDPARERLPPWAAAGGCAQPPMAAEQIRRRLVYIGAEDVATVVVEALTKIAPPARDFVLSRCCIIEVGRITEGWFGAAPVARAGCEPLQMIALNGRISDAAALAGLFAHEAAHAWLLPHRSPATAEESAASREARRSLLTLAADWKLEPRVYAPAVRDEWQATALARAWGFTGPSTDGATCAASARRAALAELGAAVAAAPVTKPQPTGER